MDNLISISFSFIFKEIKVSLTLTARGSTLPRTVRVQLFLLTVDP